MIKATKYSIDSILIHGEFSEHNSLKNTILNSIAEQESDSLVQIDSYYSDTINKLDWSRAKDFNRSWVKIIKPKLENYLDLVAQRAGYQRVIIEELWFQQYAQGNTHGWHIHGSNYTGVYYLELDESGPKTELVVPNNQNQIVVPDIKEGDILLFPSYTIHRAPQVHNNIRKTIISFNFIFNLINPDLLKVLNKT